MKRKLLPPRIVILLLTVAVLPGPGASLSGEGRPRFPLDAPADLVASFGEYRPDHLHPGVDFSTGGRVGLPVHAVAAGRIVRLKVEWRGYGRALYLQHPDGRISVYAHLERYEDRRLGLEKLVSDARAKRGVRYPGDIYLDPPLPVKGGEVIGYSGESGAGLPHLHFEMRLQDQEPADPLVPGWMAPGEAPIFESVVFRADSAGTWFGGERLLEAPLRRGPDGVYAPGRVVPVSGPFLPEARIHSEDRQGHRLGVKGIRVRLDGMTVYRFRLESFRFAQYPEVGLLMDHSRSRLSPPSYTYFLARLKGNDLGGAEEGDNPWPSSLPPGEHRLEVEAEGALGGTSRAVIPFRMLPPLSLRWEGKAAAGARQVLRFGIPRADLGSGIRVTYRVLGGTASLACGDPEQLPDGESCHLGVPYGSRGFTAELFQGSLLLGRATRFFPGESTVRPAAPQVRIEPSRRFVDLRIRFGDGQEPPARIRIGGSGEERRFDLVETAPGHLLGTVPVESWKDKGPVALEWEGAQGPEPEPVTAIAHLALQERALELQDCGIRLVAPPGALYESLPLHCEFPGPVPVPGAGLTVVGNPVNLLPQGVPLARKATLTFPIPSDPNPEKIDIYRLDSLGKRWVYQGGERGENRIALPVGRLDTFALLRDGSPPRILGVDPPGTASGPSARPLIRVRVEDQGSGLNYDGVHLILEGRELETEFDPDRGWSTASLPSRLPQGRHQGTAWAVDRAGNRSAPLDFEVRIR